MFLTPSKPTHDCADQTRLPFSPNKAANKPSRIPHFLAAATLVFLSACGGGGGSTTTTTTTPVVVDPLAPVATTNIADLTGIGADGVGGDSGGDSGADGAAGDGAPLKGAEVTLVDAKGNEVKGKTDSNGRFLLKFKSSVFTAPFVARVSDAGGNVLASVTDEVAITGKSIKININPLTDKITSDVIPADVAGTDKVFNGSKVSGAKLAAAKANLLASVKDALATAGIADSSKFDPIKSVYAYDGTGVDAIIESISHSRDPATGATQLRAKLAGVTNAADGTTNPTLITAGTPLAVSQVAIASNQALTFGKINAWVNSINACLATSSPSALPSTPECQDDDGSRLISNSYKQNSRNFEFDFTALVSENDRSHVPGSVFKNPAILAFTRSPGATFDDRAVVEFTIDQPRTGPLSGNITTPIQYTKVVIFKRDDSLTRAVAGNWIAFGNQRSYDWGVEPLYLAQTQLNPSATNFPSQMRSGVRMNFSSTVLNTTTNSFISAGVFAVRMKGPGLPATGVVLAPTSTATVATFTILNKTGVIPSPGTLATAVQRDFRMSGAILGTGAALAPTDWNGANVYSANTATETDMSKLQAYNRYTAEIYRTADPANPVIESTLILAPVQTAVSMAKIPLQDLTPSTSVIAAGSSVSSVTVAWARVTGAVKIESAFALFFGSGPGVTNSVNLSDAFSLNPTSTSAVVTNGATGFPASNATQTREVGLFGRAARSAFNTTLIRTN